MHAHQFHRAQWRKSTHSGQNGGCVEVAPNLPGIVAIRDSKNPNGPKLTVSPGEWASFLVRIRQR